MKKISRGQINEAVDCLKRGGVVLFPTETAYGLAVDATNEKAVSRLAVLKGRDVQKTFPIIVSSTAMAKKYGCMNRFSLRLAKKYWPGPLTMVVEARTSSILSRGVVRDDGTIAVRVSSHPVARALSKKLGSPITSTSANVAGEGTPYLVSDVNVKADYVLDCGKLPKRNVSTIVRVMDDEIKILRSGSIRPTT